MTVKNHKMTNTLLFLLISATASCFCSGPAEKGDNSGKRVQLEYPTIEGVSVQVTEDTKTYLIGDDGNAIEPVSGKIPSGVNVCGSFVSNLFVSCGEISGFSIPEPQTAAATDPSTGRYCCMVYSGISHSKGGISIQMLSLPSLIRVPISGIPASERLVSVELISGEDFFVKDFICGCKLDNGEHAYSAQSVMSSVSVLCPDVSGDFAFVDFCVIPIVRASHLLSGATPSGETKFTLNVNTEKNGMPIKRQYTDLIIHHADLCSNGILSLLNDGKSFNLSSDFQAQCTVDVSSQRKQLLHFGIDGERLWYFWDAQRERLCQLAAGELKVDFARVAINAAYEREEGNKKLAAYTQDIIPLMRYLRQFNPEIKFFASPRPLKEAYNSNTESELINSIFKNGDISMYAYPIWVGGNKNILLEQYKKLDRDKMIRYLSDYLNLMHEYGFDIDYMDLVNEDQSIWANDIDNIIYVVENIPAHLNEGVKMPLIVFPSTWSPSDGFKKFLDVPSVAAKRAEVISKIGVVSTHNTPDNDINKFDYANLKKFADAVHEIDPDKELWNSEMHAWIGTKDPAADIRNSEILWKHLIAGFSGIDTWLFFGPWGGAAHPMVYSNGTNPPVTTAKYEIFKVVVNEVTLGHLLHSVSSNEDITSVAMCKDDRVVICLHNLGSSPVNTLVNLPPGTKVKGSIILNLWEEHMKDIAPRLSSIDGHDGKGSFQVRVPAASLQILVMTIGQ